MPTAPSKRGPAANTIGVLSTKEGTGPAPTARRPVAAHRAFRPQAGTGHARAGLSCGLWCRPGVVGGHLKPAAQAPQNGFRIEAKQVAVRAHDTLGFLPVRSALMAPASKLSITTVLVASRRAKASRGTLSAERMLRKILPICSSRPAVGSPLALPATGGNVDPAKRTSRSPTKPFFIRVTRPHHPDLVDNHLGKLAYLSKRRRLRQVQGLDFHSMLLREALRAARADYPLPPRSLKSHGSSRETSRLDDHRFDRPD